MASSSLGQLHIWWYGEVLLLSPHSVSLDPIWMSCLPEGAETTWRSVNLLSYWFPGKRNKGTNRSGGAEIALALRSKDLQAWFQLAPGDFCRSSRDKMGFHTLVFSVFSREGIALWVLPAWCSASLSKNSRFKWKNRISCLSPGDCIG